ncbi:hypothetical protein [Amycolatopsis pigmentata]|uniref:Uncharacterized protein n=1 Tax=Amycolatopsis pigmentata TaxID=450801 RepID=A0ABW5FLT2_9PSEU
MVDLAAHRADQNKVLHRAEPDGAPALWINGKGRKRRWVRLTSMALVAVEEYLAERDQAQTTREIAPAGQVPVNPPAIVRRRDQARPQPSRSPTCCATWPG